VAAPPEPRRFFDASILGVGHLLSAKDSRVIYPGHPDWPYGPREKDPVWLRFIAEQGWTAFLRDKHLRSRTAEYQALTTYRVRVVNLTVRKNLSPAGYAELLSRHAGGVNELELALPAYYHLTQGGIRCLLRYED